MGKDNNKHTNELVILGNPWDIQAIQAIRNVSNNNLII